jgi:hypothetical protein
MKRPAKIYLVGVLATMSLFIIVITGCYSTSYIRGAKEDPSSLWMEALKPFGGRPYYVGSEGDFSYFRAGDVIWTRYKAQTSKIRLPRTFPLGTGKPYPVTEDMVPKY